LFNNFWPFYGHGLVPHTHNRTETYITIVYVHLYLFRILDTSLQVSCFKRAQAEEAATTTTTKTTTSKVTSVLVVAVVGGVVAPSLADQIRCINNKPIKRLYN